MYLVFFFKPWLHQPDLHSAGVKLYDSVMVVHVSVYTLKVTVLPGIVFFFFFFCSQKHSKTMRERLQQVGVDVVARTAKTNERCFGCPGRILLGLPLLQQRAEIPESTSWVCVSLMCIQRQSSHWSLKIQYANYITDVMSFVTCFYSEKTMIDFFLVY